MFQILNFMRGKKIAILVILLFFIVIYFFRNLFEPYPSPSGNSGFVSLNEKGFSLNGAPFYPIVLNYMVNIYTDGKSMWPVPNRDYGNGSKFRFEKPYELRKEFMAEMQMIRDMGFNTVRIVGIGEMRISDEPEGRKFVKAFLSSDRDTVFNMKDPVNYENYMKAIGEVFSVCDSIGLKVIFLTRMFKDVPETKEHLV